MADLRSFVEDVRAKGASPVLATSIPHSGGFSEKDGVMSVRGGAAGIGPYVAKTRELAAEMDVPLLDLNRFAVETLPKLGLEKANALYMRIKPGEYKRLPNGMKDGCHTRDTVAYFYSSAAVQMAREQKLKICELFKPQDEVAFEPYPWRIEREKDAFAYKVGTVVSVTNGEMRATYTTRRINHAWVAELKDVAADLPRSKDVTIDDLYSHPLTLPGAEDLWGRIVRCAGTVRDINRRQTFTQIQLGEGTRSFQAAVRINIDTPLPDDLKLGAKVLVGGVMLYSPVDDPVRHVMIDFTDVSVMPMDINGVEILSKAPFWTVKTHAKSILQKLEVQNTAGAIIRAFELGLLRA